jgi:drug/metabolite transporter (DMT)-like permease
VIEMSIGDAIWGRGLRTPFRGRKRRGALGACAASFGLPDLLHYFSLQSLSLSLVSSLSQLWAFWVV